MQKQFGLVDVEVASARNVMMSPKVVKGVVRSQTVQFVLGLKLMNSSKPDMYLHVVTHKVE